MSNIPRLDKWIPCDSRADMDDRLRRIPGRVVAEIKTDDARVWGFMTLEDLIIPIGYAELGLEPQSAKVGKIIAVGINELVVGIDLTRSAIVFRYRMPTVFHEFLKANQHGILLRDELGFVWLSLAGEERWSFSTGDIIETFSIQEDKISGVTTEGAPFEVLVPAH